jgi:RNA polymerase sigma-54 factor
VARAALLELTQEELEEEIREKLEENPALEITFRERTASLREERLDGAQGPDGALGRICAAPTLADDLKWQLRAVLKGEALRIAEYLVDSLDRRGYLTTPLWEVAEDLGVSEQAAERALEALHELEPRGVGARDLAECLRLQLASLPARDVPDGLYEFLHTEFAAFSQNARAIPAALKDARVRRYMDFIARRLYPYPADLFRAPYGPEESVRATTPDAVITVRDGRLEVSVPLSERLALRVNATYARLAQSTEPRAQGRDGMSVRGMVAEARETIANLTHRHQIIGRVAAAVVSEQQEYLTRGPAGLRPFSKKELSQKLRLHESTVCRATRGKTVMLPDGEVVPLDLFFEDNLPAKVTLAQIVRREDPRHPLRDHELVALMQERGYPVARRTISKYRAALEIPSAADRKRAAEGR